MSAFWRKWLPAAVLLGGILATTGLIAVQPKPVPRPPERERVPVRVLLVEPQAVRIDVRAQGTVEPRTEADLVAEVSGRLVWVSPALEAGGTFAKGEVLARIDDADLQAAAERARAAVQRAESRTALEKGRLERRRSLRSAGAASSAALDEAEANAGVAAADLREARAVLDQAERDLARAEITAPFDGRARESHADAGAFLARGAPLARIYAVDWAEVRLPIPDSELAFLDVPGMAGEPTPEPPSGAAAGSRVELRGRFAGADNRWEGRLVGVEGALDTRTRMVTLVARVDRQQTAAGELSLPVGLFVEARIEGRHFASVVQLPRSALREGSKVVVVDAEQRMQLRSVELLRVEGESVFVGSGLESGERVCTSPLELAVPGMPVRVVASEKPASGAASVGPASAPSRPDTPAHATAPGSEASEAGS